MLDPADLAIATALATNAVNKIGESVGEGTVNTFKSLCKKVFARFRDIPEAQEDLDSARVDSDDSQTLAKVAEHLHRAEQEDPEIARLMAELRSAAAEGAGGSVTNTIHGGVSGDAKVIQGRDISGDLNL